MKTDFKYKNPNYILDDQFNCIKLQLVRFYFKS